MDKQTLKEAFIEKKKETDERIIGLTGINWEEYCELQFNTGVVWAEYHYPVKVSSILIKSPLYWSWFQQIWQVQCRSFLNILESFWRSNMSVNCKQWFYESFKVDKLVYDINTIVYNQILKEHGQND